MNCSNCMKRFLKKITRLFCGLGMVYLLLLIPDPKEKTAFVKAGEKAFTWNRDAQWVQMEELFRHARQQSPALVDSAIRALKLIAGKRLALLEAGGRLSSDSNWVLAENTFFSMAASVAVRPAELPWFINYYNSLRNLIKERSRQWQLGDIGVRNTVYALAYGLRAAVEEVLLQTDTVKIPPAMLVKNEMSATPSAQIFGIEVHSGDLLVSRGGAEVSALISRGNDYPGNFSHVALVYVEEKSNKAFLVEAHIEKGVAVSSVQQYENDKKLRFMVLRLRANLPLMMADPMLPQKAAQAMYEKANSRHISYDFKMDFHDSSAMFCSEVASYAYRGKGIQLWQSQSTISSQGIVNWLHAFGVENFVTQMPSDLEYDPQLTIVAEWRDPATLFKDHIDNAVMDVLLEKANRGESIGYSTWKLPVARVIKGYYMLKNLFGKTGIIPEGMSATQALKNESFVAMHADLKKKTEILAGDFIKQNGYRPPYWQLVKLAERAAQ